MKIVNLTHESNFMVFPEHTNYMPPMIFGGKMLSEMDICAAVTVRRAMIGTLCDSAVTVGVDKVKFFAGAIIGDLIYLRGTVVKTGIKSIQVFVECEREHKDGQREKIAEGYYTFVSRQDSTPHPHGLTMD